MVRALVFAAVCAGIIYGALFFGGYHRGGGPLGKEGGNAWGAPVIARARVSVGVFDLFNKSGRKLEIDHVRLGPHTPGLKLLGVRAYSERRSEFVVMTGFPPATFPRDMRPRKLVDVRGVDIAPHGSRQLLVGLRTNRPGSFDLRGLEVEYHARYAFGIGIPYRRRTESLVRLCARRPGEPSRLCRAPSPS